MKNVTRYRCWPCLFTGCAQQIYCSNKPAAVAPKETITHHFLFRELAEETVDAAKICGGAENKEETEPSKHS